MQQDAVSRDTTKSQATRVSEKMEEDFKSSYKIPCDDFYIFRPRGCTRSLTSTETPEMVLGLGFALRGTEHAYMYV